MAITAEQRPLTADRILAQEAAEAAEAAQAAAQAAAADFLAATGDGGYLSPDALPRLAGPIGGWKFKLATDRDNAKLVKIVDSNSEARTAASNEFQRLGIMHTQPGEALAGLGSGDVIPDGIGDGTTTYKTAADRFIPDDVGRALVGRQVPQGTAIMAYVGPREVTLNNAVAAGAGLVARVGRHIISGGNNGRPLIDWWNLPSEPFPAMSYNVDRLVADAPDLGIIEALTNDIRTGLLGDTIAACYANGRARMVTIIEGLRELLPATDWLLVTPATFLSANTGGLNYVTDSLGNINPAGQAQIYSTALYLIYESLRGVWPNVDVLNTQDLVFGTLSLASSPLMANQIHPSTPTASDLWALNGSGGGYSAVADAIAAHIGFGRNPFPSSAAWRSRSDLVIYSGGVGFVRVISRDGKAPAPLNAALFAGDSLYANGLAGPASLAGTAVHRAFSSEWVELNGGGLAGIDFSALVGNVAMVAGNHAPTLLDSVPVFVDLPNIAAGASITHQVDVPGVLYGSVGSRVGTVPNPGLEFSTGNCRLTGWRIPAAGKVDLFISNPSGADVNHNGELWYFPLFR